MSNEISEFFDTEPFELVDTTPMEDMSPIVHADDDIVGNAKKDYHKVRESMTHMIDKGTEMIDKLAKVAGESESPRAYEVMATYLKTLSEMNKGLMELHKDAKDITMPKDQAPTGVQKGDPKVAFIGSTEQLQEFLKQPNAET